MRGAGPGGGRSPETGAGGGAAAAPGRPLRWGVLSTANIGRAAVVPALHAAEGCEVVAVASRDGGRARDFAAANGIPRHHGSYEALLDDPEVDALYVPLPNRLHREWTERAVAAGKHVLCEKPLAATEADCRSMGGAAEAAGVVLMEAFMYRFHPRTLRVLEMLREGAVGPVRSVRSVFTFRLRDRANIRLDPELDGGALMDVGCYCVNASRTLVGSEPVEAAAWADQGPSGVDESLAGMLRFEGGCVAHFDCSLALERREAYEVAGPEGVLHVPSAFLPGTDGVAIEEVRGREGVTRHVVDGADEYRLMVEHFAACVREGRPARWGVEDAALNMRAIEALYRSARDGGRPQRVG